MVLQPNSRTDFLKSVPLFSGLPDELIGRLADQVRVRELSKDQVLFYQGDEGGSLVIVIEGKLTIQSVDPSGAVRHLADRGVGEHVGEMSLIDDQPRSADVTALEPTKVFLLNRRDFEKAVLEFPELGLNVMRALAKRLREASQRMTQQGSLDVMGRLAVAIIELAQGNIVRTSQRAIAERIGTSRETVNRNMAILTDIGAITVSRTEIQILDLDYLVKRSQQI